jgi:hypothetical protein
VEAALLVHGPGRLPYFVQHPLRARDESPEPGRTRAFASTGARSRHLTDGPGGLRTVAQCRPSLASVISGGCLRRSLARSSAETPQAGAELPRCRPHTLESIVGT